jgi:glycosyltransferase involved in cell wall biosynthesis
MTGSIPGRFTYVLITPARNEQAFIGQTIESVIAQKIPPLKWVIVSDGSTDDTDAIVSRYAAEHPWIELVRMPERRERHFAGKVYAFRAGHERLAGLQYHVIGNLDADITFDPEYLSYLVSRFEKNPKLGVAGTPYEEGGKPAYDYRFASMDFVPGACQMFRRECFAEIGGYQPITGGTVDSIAVITARMKGWDTRIFTDKTCIHHRLSGTAQSSVLKARFKCGAKDYALGNHPLFEVFRTIFQMTRSPIVAGGMAMFWGYAWSWIQRKDRPASAELVAFRRREQIERLKRMFTRGPFQQKAA